MKKLTLSAIVLLLVMLTAACGNSGGDGKGGESKTESSSANAAQTDSSKEDAAPTAEAEQADFKRLGDEPLTLSFYSTSGTFPDTEFKTLIADPIHKKYPNVTIERITPAADTTVEEVLSTHTPDIIYSSSTTHQEVIRTGAYEDLRELIKRHNFDVTRIKPILWNYITEITKGKGDQIYAIPFNSNQHVLYYNKDIFDKFGVEYPTDEQQTWDQILEIAKKLTRTENGVHYIGLSVDNLTGLAKGLGLPILDHETGNAALDTPEWHRIFELNKQIFEIPGYITPEGTWNWGRDQFMKDQVVAMRVTWLANMVGPLEELRQQGVEFNWDIAPAPNFEDQLGKTREAQVHTLSVNSQSKHKDEAFQVIAEILSDDGQRILARNGRIPAITNPDLEKEYGLDIPVLQGKKVQNVFIGTPLQEHYFHPFETSISSRLTEAAEDLAVNGLDVNSVIRKTSDAINKDVETLRTTYGDQ
ncbi:multiple sugar transport system substrate-binding protein [Paenibacillus cellulosilyticus]|uniref:Multiple sugar transport system substrate-binding protein n=1 Tax=Paenibacillus cellulosilyticus TaxID=375489 RepID=A0A2V2Z5W9_9BACL|nr:extracellular solute-binding protein [Paenibacillus cellulosilyticus]PWW06240.1 multiple sugar transport system substrate-binding protein [Paenibacillus cellulosilyticus]